LLLARQATEAEKLLSRALELEPRSSAALVSLASNLRWQARTHRDSLGALLRLLLKVTADKSATSTHWTARGWVEEALGDKAAAVSSYERALSLEPQNYRALIARAQARANAGEYESAITDAQAARRLAPGDAEVSLQSIRIYLQAGKRQEARRDWDALDETTKARPEAAAMLSAMLSCDETPENRAELEKALKTTPRDAQLLACLGAAYRRADPSRSLEFYHRAADLEPKNPDPAVGYLSALVQARRFEEAAVIARRVLQVAPERYEAHANLATALYELKRYPEALVEFGWLAEAKPDLAATYFFIATAHDYLGEYAEALKAYEGFLARADAHSNQLEIEKVNLRLPALRNQIKRGEGAKQKKGK
jgi:tetratricopeptide (TPR) repeat protein